jgi:ABC-type nitrate/sulfonate/bicarbonate transport system substrate-binding protein
MAAIASLLALAAAGCAKSDASSGEQDKVLQYLGTAGSVILPELAEALGYFETIRLERVGNSVGGPESIQLAATGEIDFGVAFQGAILKSYAKGVKVKAVIASSGTSNGNGLYGYVLEDSGIGSGRDLIGKKVAVNILGANLEFVTKAYLKNEGLTDDEIRTVSFITLPASNYELGLRNRQVDLVLLSGINQEVALSHGGLKELFRERDVVGQDYISNSIFFSESYIRRNPDTVREFTAGVARAIEWIKATPREDIIARMEEIIKSRGNNETTDLLRYYKKPGIATEGGLLSGFDFQIVLDWLEENGEIEKDRVKAADVFTNEFNPYAD